MPMIYHIDILNGLITSLKKNRTELLESAINLAQRGEAEHSARELIRYATNDQLIRQLQQAVSQMNQSPQ